MNSSGVPLTQKREPRLCQLKPRIDVNNGRLVLRMKGEHETQDSVSRMRRVFR